MPNLFVSPKGTIITNPMEPLLSAVYNGNTEEVIKLINERANVNAINDHGSTALMLASAKCDTETVSKLLEAGANVNAINNYGQTALMVASMHKCKETALELIGKEADVETAKNGLIQKGMSQEAEFLENLVSFYLTHEDL